MEDPDRRQLVAVAAVIVRDRAILAMRRSPCKDAGAGIWETLSGRVEPAEAPLNAVAREIAEESGVDVELDPRPVDAYEAVRGDQPMVVIVYRARWRGGEVVRSDEHDDHCWCTIDEFAARCSLSPLVQAARRALALPWP